MTLIIFENSNLLLGFVPESIAMLAFGIGLISLAVGLRWTLTQLESDEFVEDEPIRHLMDREDRISTSIESQLKINGK